MFIALMKYRQGDSNQVKISIEKLSEITGYSTKQITRHINILIEHGFVERSHQVFGWGEFSINTYTLYCLDDKFAMIPYVIAFEMGLKPSELIGYANIKRLKDLRRTDKMVFATKEQLAEALQTSPNNVDKIKRRLKEAGLIDFERNSPAIELTWELNNFTTNSILERKQQVEKTVKTKNAKGVNHHANSDII
jgi:DNA-binding MarR family transcriptional regulator